MQTVIILGICEHACVHVYGCPRMLLVSRVTMAVMQYVTRREMNIEILHS